MCEAALLCRLTCSRFAASGSNYLVTDHGRGVAVKYQFGARDTVMTLTVATQDGKAKSTARTVVNDKLMKNVVPKGKDGGAIFTAALARETVDWTSHVRVHVYRPPGVAPSLPRIIDARDMAAVVAAFCKLRVHSFSVQLATALLTQCVSITFNKGYAAVSTGAALRRIHLPAGTTFVSERGTIRTDTNDPQFNTDLIVAGLCHTLFSMI